MFRRYAIMRSADQRDAMKALDDARAGGSDDPMKLLKPQALGLVPGGGSNPHDLAIGGF